MFIRCLICSLALWHLKHGQVSQLLLANTLMSLSSLRLQSGCSKHKLHTPNNALCASTELLLASHAQKMLQSRLYIPETLILRHTDQTNPDLLRSRSESHETELQTTVTQTDSHPFKSWLLQGPVKSLCLVVGTEQTDPKSKKFKDTAQGFRKKVICRWLRTVLRKFIAHSRFIDHRVRTGLLCHTILVHRWDPFTIVL